MCYQMQPSQDVMLTLKHELQFKQFLGVTGKGGDCVRGKVLEPLAFVGHGNLIPDACKVRRCNLPEPLRMFRTGLVLKHTLGWLVAS